MIKLLKWYLYIQELGQGIDYVIYILKQLIIWKLPATLQPVFSAL